MAPKDNSPAINIPDWMFKIFLAVLGCIIAFTLNRNSAEDDKMNDKLDLILKQTVELQSDIKSINKEVSRVDGRLNAMDLRLRELELQEARRDNHTNIK